MSYILKCRSYTLKWKKYTYTFASLPTELWSPATTDLVGNPFTPLREHEHSQSNKAFCTKGTDWTATELSNSTLYFELTVSWLMRQYLVQLTTNSKMSFTKRRLSEAKSLHYCFFIVFIAEEKEKKKGKYTVPAQKMEGKNILFMRQPKAPLKKIIGSLGTCFSLATRMWFWTMLALF